MIPEALESLRRVRKRVHLSTRFGQLSGPVRTVAHPEWCVSGVRPEDIGLRDESGRRANRHRESPTPERSTRPVLTQAPGKRYRVWPNVPSAKAKARSGYTE